MPNAAHTATPYRAFLFDLDGVVTQTVELHFAAWKELFDGYLARRGSPSRLFGWDDYRTHVDGKPRFDGVRDFLRAVGVELPYGDPDDPPDANTVCGLGNRKDEAFHRQLQQHGARTFPDAVELLHSLKRRGAPTAAVSSSKNAAQILESAGIAQLFDARVDGRTGEARGLSGKPAPDYFTEAAQRLGVPPEQCVVFEDAVSGVEAGRRGGFGLVVGVARHGEIQALHDAGADTVVEELARLDAHALPHRDLPSALDHADSIGELLARHRPSAFLDYDGTLTPIVSRPEDAVLSEEMRARLVRLSACFPVAIVSGRDLDDVRTRVALPQLYYVGSHGLDIAGSSGDPLQHQPAGRFLPALHEVEAALRRTLHGIEGAQIERKRYSVAVHYRNVASTDVARVAQAVSEALQGREELQRGAGKKVIELKPRIDWHKGAAVSWLLEHLRLTEADARTLYIGDDVTDEDAFRALRSRGIGVLVSEEPRASLAHYRLRDVDEVGRLLDHVIASLPGGVGS